MSRSNLLLGAALIAAAVWLTEESDDDVGEIELPTTCRECGERERTYNTFRCPTCHSQMTPDDHPALATEYDGDHYAE